MNTVQVGSMVGWLREGNTAEEGRAMRAKKPLWGRFADEMLEGSRDRASKIMAKMVGEEREDAERWFYGRPSRNTQAAFEEWVNSVTDEEILRNCQFDGMPNIGKRG